MSFEALNFTRLEYFRSKGFAPGCVYDIGASSGCWSWRTQQIFPDAEYHLFEPLAEALPAYREAQAQHRAAGLRGTLHVLALGREDGQVMIGVDPAGYGSSVLVGSVNEYFPQRVTVRRETIDGLVGRGLPPPQLIKMDTQGAELTILQGAERTLPQVQILQIETWLVRGYGPETPLLAEVTNWLAHRGFYTLDIGSEYRDAQGVLTAQDVFFVNDAIAVEALRGRRAYAA